MTYKQYRYIAGVQKGASHVRRTHDGTDYLLTI
jgi:hypothetical protein